MNRVFQTYKFFEPPVRSLGEVGRLESSAKLPHAPQFWIEMGEIFTNWLIRIFKLGVPIPQQKVRHHEIVVDRARVGESVAEHFMQFTRETGDPPVCILMGRDIFEPLIGELRQQLSFDCSFRVAIQSRYRVMEYYGVRVICIPWMSGIIALPDISKELQ